MHTYLVERKIATKSMLKKLKATPNAPSISWQHSYVTGDKCYCVYNAPNERALQHHMQQAGFPASRISKIVSVLDPTKLEAIIDPTKLAAIIDPTKL